MKTARHIRASPAASPLAPERLVASGPADDVWRAALDAVPDSVALLDEDCSVIVANRAWRAFAEADGGGGVGTNYLDVCDRAGACDPLGTEVAGALREIAAGRREAYACVYPCHSPDAERWFSMQMVSLPGVDTRRIVVTHHDVTAQHEALRRSRAQAELLDAVGAATTVTDLDGLLTHWSDGAEALYGWAAADVLGQRLSAVTAAPEGRAAADAQHCETVAVGKWEGQPEVCHRQGRRFPVLARFRLLHDDAGAPSGVIGVAVDVTDRVAMEQQLRGARDFRDAVLQTMPDGLYVLDGDGRTTLVNETAERLLRWPRGALLNTVLHEQLQPLTVLGEPRPEHERLDARALREGVALRDDDDVFQRRDGTFVPVTYTSVPFTSEAGELGSLVVFNDITERRARELAVRRDLDALSWVGRVHEALDEDRLVLYAQPIVTVARGETVGHELLLRMLGPDGEVFAPGEFLPAAEEHGLIRTVDRRVLQLALIHVADGWPVHVNLSADSIGDPSLFGYVQDAFEARGVDPRLVVFEITETALIENEAAALTFTQAVTELGCTVALDDFGTGYGTFHYLKHLAVGVLKIDREFVRDLGGDEGEASRHVITAIVSLAKGMGKQTVAEGVETAAELAVVRELGVDLAQGYLFARPVPAVELFTRGAE